MHVVTCRLSGVRHGISSQEERPARLFAVFPPQAGTLPAGVDTTGLKTDIVPLSLLDGSYQIGLFHLTRLDIVLFCYLFDLVKFHVHDLPENN